MQGILIFIILVIIETGLCLHSREKPETKNVEGMARFIKDREDQQQKLRAKRNSVQFGVMVACKVGRNPVDYLGYGCFCGIGGNGEPVDEIDQCCYEHDQCYNKLIEKKICKPSSAVYTTTYLIKGCTNCVSWQTRCMKKLCECDATAAKCFKNHDSKFKNEYKNHDQSKC